MAGHLHPHSSAPQTYYSSASMPYALLASDHDDPLHLPEPEPTLYTASYAPGTAIISMRVLPGETWDGWEWVYAPDIFGGPNL